MPNGSFRPLAKTAICSGLAGAADSAEHFDVAGLGLGHEKVAVGGGANDPRIASPAAYCSTLKPAGTCGHAPSGRATTLRTIAADGVA